MDKYSKDYKHFDNLIWQVPTWATAIFLGVLLTSYQVATKETSVGFLAKRYMVALVLCAGLLFLLACCYTLFRFRCHQAETTADGPFARFVSGQFGLQFNVLFQSTVLLALVVHALGGTKLNELIYQTWDLPKQYETDSITSEEFFEKIVELCGLNITKPEFIKAFTDIFTPIKTTFILIRKLKPNYKLGLLSNVSKWDFEYGIKLIEVFDLFDSVSLSFEVKAMKPDKKIFYDALTKLKLTAKKCIYIDDIQEHVEAANQIGMYGIQYTSYESLVDSLRKLNIRV